MSFKPDLHYADSMIRELSVQGMGFAQCLETMVETEKEKPAPQVAEFYLRVKAFKEAVEELSKQVNALQQHMSYTVIPSVFERDGFKSFTTDSGYRVTLSETVRALINAERKPDAYQWLRDNDAGSLITETVNASTLSSFAKNKLQDAEELPDDLFKVAVVTSTSVTKTKK